MLDFIGIGLGPFNLSLAALLNQHSSLNYHFFDKRQDFDWHSGIQLPNAMMQVPFMADLVSLVEPTSPYSFLNYLKAHQRLYKFYFRENLYIPRQEYNHYCQWVVKQLEHLQFGSRVTDIAPILGGFQVITEQKGRLSVHQTRKLVLGTGTTAKLPQPLQRIAEQNKRCLHSSNYLHQCDEHLSGKGHFKAVMRMMCYFIFEHSLAEKIVGEPDENVKSYDYVAEEIAFEAQQKIQMLEKTAILYHCFREKFYQSCGAYSPLN